MSVATLCSYNVLFRNSREIVASDVKALSKQASLIALQEVTPDAPPARGVADAVAELGWASFVPDDGDNVLVWDPRTWQADNFRGSRRVAMSAADAGLAARFNPRRYVLWQGFKHRESGSRQLVYCTHLVAGYAKPEGSFPDRLEDYKDDAARVHMLKLVRLVATHMLRTDYDAHHLLGDLNSQQRRDDLWWYPARLLDGLFMPDVRPESIDWMLHSSASAASGMRLRRRWAMKLHSDHPAHLKTVTW